MEQTKRSSDLEYFRRHLSEPFLEFLSQGPGRTLMDAFRLNDLDVRLRDDYLNAYSVGNSLAKVSNGRGTRRRLSVNVKYLDGVTLVGQVVRKRPARSSKTLKPRKYMEIDLTDDAIAAYVRAIPRIKKNAASFAKPEARWEDRCVRVNGRGQKLVVLDRQIAKGDIGKPPAAGKTRRGAVRLDLLAVLGGADRGIVAVEIKRDLDSRIQKVATQLIQYLEFLDPKKSGLAPRIADSYRVACDQLEQLGVPGPRRAQVEAGLPVYGLVALANYNDASKLLGRARLDATRHARRLYYCLIDEGDEPVLPPRSEWKVLE